jgi:hypothetical protein
MESNTNCNGSLFEVNYECKQHLLRKYEPLIRVDMDGKPLPRKLLSQIDQPPESQIPTKPVDPPKTAPPQQQNELKRSLPATVETKHEPKKKQPKGQSKITSFFNKS